MRKAALKIRKGWIKEKKFQMLAKSKENLKVLNALAEAIVDAGITVEAMSKACLTAKQNKTQQSETNK